MNTSRPDSRLGTDLGPYRIERVLGRGGMGVVYLAEQRELGRKVALKLLPDELAHDADFRARFDRESRLAAAIDHPNVIPLYEAGEVDGVLFLAMRFVDGTDLATRLREGMLTTTTAVEILAQVAGALDAAHARGLVHRDVKPGNVLLDRVAGDERPHAYLTDFGLTKQAGSDSGLTRAGAFLGTPAYMAPEQVDGLEVDGRADQYALGCVAFECLTGRVPFQREKEVAVALAHLKEPVPSAVGVRTELPSAVDNVLATVMAKDREARYPTCTAFVDDLRAALGGGMVRARAVTAVPKVRMPVAIWFGVGLVLVAAAGLALASGVFDPGSGASPSASGLAAVESPPPSVSTGQCPPTPDPSLFPSLEEETLLALLPDDVASACERGTYEAVDSDPPRRVGGTVSSGGSARAPIASVACAPESGTGADSLLVRQFIKNDVGGGGGIGTAPGFNTETVVSARATGYRAPAGDCASSSLAIDRWRTGDDERGAIFCYVDGSSGEAVLTWSYEASQVLIVARNTTGDSKALYDWFAQNARFIAP